MKRVKKATFFGLFSILVVTMGFVVATTEPSGAVTQPQIASLALANVNKGAGYCSTVNSSPNSLGGTSFDGSCTDNGGNPVYWCADFARWVWGNVGINISGLTAAAGSFVSAASQNGSTVHTSSGYVPQVGDAVVYDYNGNGYADHVGIVTSVNSDGSVGTVNGDFNGKTNNQITFAETSTVVAETLSATQRSVGQKPSNIGMTITDYVTPGGVTSSPAPVSVAVPVVSSVMSQSGVLDTFFKGSDGRLWHRWYVGGTWYGPSVVASGDTGQYPMASAPSAVGQSNGVIDVFYQTTSSGMAHEWYVGGKWYGPGPLIPGNDVHNVGSQPSAVMSQSGVLDVFYKALDNTLWHAWYVGGAWYGPQSLNLGLAMASAPSAVGQSNGTVDVFWRTPSNTLGHEWYNPGTGAGTGWNGPQQFGNNTASQPSAVLTQPGVIDVFYQGTNDANGNNGGLWHEWYVGGTWYGPGALNAGTLGSAPTAVGQSNGVVDVFWKGTDNGLWHQWYSGGTWYGPQGFGGTVMSVPAAVAQPNGVIDVFWKEANSGLGHQWYVSGTWYGPQDMGGTLG